MDKHAVIEIVAKIGRMRPAAISEHMSLASVGITKSLGLSALRSHIETQSGVRLGAIDVDLTIAELVKVAAGELTSKAGRTGPPASVQDTASTRAKVDVARLASLPEFAIGLDLQDVAALPPANDMRTDPFYSAHFAPSELATAALRPDPRSHLCGIFSAKEAVKKSHPELLGLGMDRIIIDHDASGRPSLRFADADLQSRFHCSLSITHSAGFAAATCLTIAA